ncbi:MAG: F0F1 ATP synthase subunit A [Anaerolineae bacterium]|nr:F0F1 ATP synthase subunit A [Anaerolineae bacterium]MDW8099944.1 F0F1 ATP synthase subunit A [Anaerolineae bacterium]
MQNLSLTLKRFFNRRNTAILVGTLVILIGGRILFPVPLPTIQLPAEKIPGLTVLGFPITNTLLATLLADLTLLAIVLAVRRRMTLIPSGLQNLVEWFLETFYNLAEEMAGAKARRFFPFFMTILLFLLVANWWELFPGFDSIGIIEPAHKEGMRSYKIKELGPIAILTAEPLDEGEHGYVLVPFLRAAATDLNLPLALALIVIVYVQVTGFRDLGRAYLRKFFNFKTPVDGFVGILELISEFAKIISFTFRLFGNIFAGQVLLFVVPFLIPFLVVLPFYGLELFVGFMQAFVFATLSLVFLSMAGVSHEGHSEHSEASH